MGPPLKIRTFYAPQPARIKMAPTTECCFCKITEQSLALKNESVMEDNTVLALKDLF